MSYIYSYTLLSFKKRCDRFVFTFCFARSVSFAFPGSVSFTFLATFVLTFSAVAQQRVVSVFYRSPAAFF